MVVDISFVRLYQCLMIDIIERRSLPVEARPPKARPRPRGRRSRQRRARRGDTDNENENELNCLYHDRGGSYHVVRACSMRTDTF